MLKMSEWLPDASLNDRCCFSSKNRAENQLVASAAAGFTAAVLVYAC